MTPLRAKMIHELELHRKAPKTIEAYVTGMTRVVTEKFEPNVEVTAAAWEE